jgi:hypothetical protein
LCVWRGGEGGRGASYPSFTPPPHQPRHPRPTFLAKASNTGTARVSYSCTVIRPRPQRSTCGAQEGNEWAHACRTWAHGREARGRTRRISLGRASKGDTVWAAKGRTRGTQCSCALAQCSCPPPPSHSTLTSLKIQNASASALATCACAHVCARVNCCSMTREGVCAGGALVGASQLHASAVLCV